MADQISADITSAQNVYEGLFLFDANKFTRDRDTLSGDIEKMISSEGGEVLVSRLWEERRLAYSINGHRKGAYWLIYFRSDSQAITPLNRKCELYEGLMRHLVLKIHSRLVEPILEHASADHAEIPEPVAAAPAKAEAPDKAKETPETVATTTE